MVRSPRACRGLRAWRVLKGTHRTKEARKIPAALIARAKQEGRHNDKEWLLILRESDWSIVSRGKAPAPTLEKEPFVEHMRERVVLKSPVREYRPPGSVRGAPGNRCPYLDTFNARSTGGSTSRRVGPPLSEA